MKKRILFWLKEFFNRRDTKDIAKKRLEFVVTRDRNEQEDWKLKWLKRKLESTLSRYIEEVMYQIEIPDGIHTELSLHIPLQHIKISKEEENEYCVNCK